jgi:hypothetical protein
MLEPDVENFSPTKLTQRAAKNIKRLFFSPVRWYNKQEKEKK